MEPVNIHYAKTHLSRLIEHAEQGEVVLIARNGTPVAKLTALRSRGRSPGRLKGRIRVADDFDAPLPEALLATFRGEAG